LARAGVGVLVPRDPRRFGDAPMALPGADTVPGHWLRNNSAR
jgi:hypothetical protein